MTPPLISPAARMDKVELIQRSLRCFTLGIVGVLPVVGLPFAVMALTNYFAVQRTSGGQWNPAHTYLTWGMATAVSGLLLTLVTVFIVAAAVVLDLA